MFSVAWSARVHPDIHLQRSDPATSRGHRGGMRITLVTETFFPAVDGTTTTVKAVADRLVDTGHDVQVDRARAPA